MTEKQPHIRSFVKREMRFSASQAHALEKYLPLYGIDNNVPLIDLQSILPNRDIILEIGFGKGESLFAQAEKNPYVGFIGVEVHRPGVGQLLNQIHKAGLSNIRICHQDVIEVLKRLPPHSLSGVQIFFPDPWPKKRHHKRRLIQPHFLDTLYRVLKPGGFIHCATDWEEYATHMLDVFKADSRFQNTSETGFISRPDRLISSFEARGLRLGHQTWDLMVYVKENI